MAVPVGWIYVMLEKGRDEATTPHSTPVFAADPGTPSART